MTEDNYSRFREYIALGSLDDIYQATDVDLICESFLNIIKYHFGRSSPLKRNSTKRWVTRGIAISSRKLKELYARAK